MNVIVGEGELGSQKWHQPLLVSGVCHVGGGLCPMKLLRKLSKTGALSQKHLSLFWVCVLESWLHIFGFLICEQDRTLFCEQGDVSLLTAAQQKVTPAALICRSHQISPVCLERFSEDWGSKRQDSVFPCQLMEFACSGIFMEVSMPPLLDSPPFSSFRTGSSGQLLSLLKSEPCCWSYPLNRHRRTTNLHFHLPYWAMSSWMGPILFSLYLTCTGRCGWCDYYSVLFSLHIVFTAGFLY